MRGRRDVFKVAVYTPLGLLLANCAGGVSQPTWQDVQGYVNDLVLGLDAAEGSYRTAPGIDPAQIATLDKLVGDLNRLNTTFQSANAPTSVRGIALQILAFSQQVLPSVTPFLGPAAAAEAALVIGVLTAFIAAQPVQAIQTQHLRTYGLKYHVSERGDGFTRFAEKTTRFGPNVREYTVMVATRGE